IAHAAVPAMLALGPARLPRSDGIEIDASVLAFALVVSVLAALMTGLAPLARTARRDAREALAENRRVRGSGVAGQRLRTTLIAAQIALTVVLLAGAGLLGRSFAKLLE